jgi:hypothetical protein
LLIGVSGGVEYMDLVVVRKFGSGEGLGCARGSGLGRESE